MPTLTVYPLTFAGGLHIGGQGDTLEQSRVTLPADTLFAALVDAHRRSGGDPQALAAPFAAAAPDPPFLLTSAFPFAGGVRFYPMPVDLTRLFTPETLRARTKALRRVRYLSEGLLRQALAGRRLDDRLFPTEELTEPQKGTALQGGQFWLTVDEIEKLPGGMQRKPGRRHALPVLPVTTTARVPRVTVDRLSHASMIYHAGRTTFAEGCGLWFGVQWRDRERRIAGTGQSYGDALAQALAMLADDGLGGERTSGYGAFRLGESIPVELPDARPDEAAWLLSRYHPANARELAGLRDPQAAYHLVKVGGWLRSYDHMAVRRRRLTLLGEGSLAPLPGPVAGDVVDVRPVYARAEAPFPHPVYRYGLALGVGREEGQHG